MRESLTNVAPIGKSGRRPNRGAGMQASVDGAELAPRRLGLTLPLAMGAGPISLYALSALSPLVIDELHLSRSQLGSLATVTFVVGAVGSMAAARATNTFGSRYVLVALFVAAGLAVGIVAAARSLLWLFVGVAVSGWAQSMSNPATNDLISVFVPSPRQGVLIGIKQSGVQMSQFLAGIALPTAALILGWRGAIAITATLAFAGWGLTLRGVPRLASASHTHGEQHQRLPFEVWWLSGYMFLMAAALQATNVYLPLFSYQRLGFGTTTAGLTVAAVGGMGLLARIFWGRVSGQAGNSRTLLMGMAVASVIAAVLLLGAQTTGRAWWVWAAATLDGTTAVAANVVVVVTVIRWMDRRTVSTASGVLAVAMYLGFAVGPLSFGLLVDDFGGYTAAWTAVGIVYAAAAVVIIIWQRLVPTVRASAQ